MKSHNVLEHNRNSPENPLSPSWAFLPMYLTRDSALSFEHAQGLAVKQQLHGKPLPASWRVYGTCLHPLFPPPPLHQSYQLIWAHLPDTTSPAMPCTTQHTHPAITSQDPRGWLLISKGWKENSTCNRKDAAPRMRRPVVRVFCSVTYPVCGALTNHFSCLFLFPPPPLVSGNGVCG